MLEFRAKLCENITKNAATWGFPFLPFRSHVKTIETADHEEEVASITPRFPLIISITISLFLSNKKHIVTRSFGKLWKNRAWKSEAKKRNRRGRIWAFNERERKGLSVLNRSESVSYANDVCCSCAAGKRGGREFNFFPSPLLLLLSTSVLIYTRPRSRNNCDNSALSPTLFRNGGFRRRERKNWRSYPAGEKGRIVECWNVSR